MSLKSGMLCAYSSLLTSIEKEFPVVVLHVQHSKKKPSSQLKGLLSIDGAHGIREGKHHEFIDVVFPFSSAYALGLLDRLKRPS